MKDADVFESAREKFRPDHIKTLFVAEAPPSVDSGRFFFFVPVTRGDTLFLEMMKVLYPRERFNINASDVRKRKYELLEQFRRDGFFLTDAVKALLPKRATQSVKKGAIRRSLPKLKGKLRELCDPDTKIVLISRPVYDICFQALKAEGFNVINTEMIDFPAAGRQPQFRQKLTCLLTSLGACGENSKCLNS